MPLVRKHTLGQPSASAKPGSAEVLSGLASLNPDERWACARAAAGTPNLARELAAALATEADPRVREAMLTSLTRMGTTAIVEHVVPLLRSTDAALRSGALDALRTFSDPVHDLLPQLLRDQSVDVRILSCDLARSLPGGEATSLLCALLREEQHVNVCAAAIEVLAELGDPEALSVLADCRQRFAAIPFLCFAIQVATDRINSPFVRNRD